MTSLHPPRPRLTLNVGITGHRAQLIPDGMTDQLTDSLDDVLRALEDATQRLAEKERALFASEPPNLRLHTALATGSDQIAALCAQKHDYHVRALLPFAPEEYAHDFAEGAESAEFKQHLENADAYLALPGKRETGDDAYVLVGKAVIAASDVLVAVWDGREGNGPGGTAHVVDLALRAGVPVLHLKINRDTDVLEPVRLLTGGDALDPEHEEIEGDESYLRLLADTLAPHAETEREQVHHYFREVEKLHNWRIEYPLLLSLVGVKKLPAHPFRQSPVAQSHEFTEEAQDPAYEGFLNAYSWSNFLAIRYAQLFRSGHVTNYCLSALAVMIALFGLIVPDVKIYLVLVELGVIGLLFYNTWVGQRGDWHRRWLQYRHLAESLRPLIYLKSAAIAAPPFRSDFIQGVHHREAGSDWTRWYAAAVWRELESPVGIMTEEKVREIADKMLREQIEPQRSYHTVNAQRMRKLDHKLHEIGNVLMWAVILSCVTFVGIYVLAHEYIKKLAHFFVVLTAGLPALGAAVFGMRGHGEHLLAASRSANTAIAMEGHGSRLKAATSLDLLAAEFESTASTMLADLNEWTVSYRERSLQIPA